MTIYKHNAYPFHFISGLKSPEMELWQTFIDSSGINADIELYQSPLLSHAYMVIRDKNINDYWTVTSLYDVKRFITTLGRKSDYPTTRTP